MTNKKTSWIVAFCFAVFLGTMVSSIHLAKAACATFPDTTKGTDTQSINVTSAGTYYIWSRLLAPDTTNNSYYLQIDGGCAFDVGDSSTIPANSWTWVNYQNGTSSSPISASLSAGMHQIVMIGNEPGVGIDRLLFLSDQTCVPTGTGSNCTPAIDTTPPTVSLSAPANGATVSGTTTLSATASDNVAVQSVQFKVDGQSVGSPDTAAPYTVNWDTTTATNASHTVTAVATDTSGNQTTSSTISIAVNNAPTVTSVQNLVFNSSTKTLSWSAYPGAAGYKIAQIHNPTGTRTTNYSWPPVTTTSCTVPTGCNLAVTPTAGETVNYGILPVDSNGNAVAGSTWAKEITVTWPSLADTTPPSTPNNLAAKAVSSSQINLSWSASTDNVGVLGYQIYRGVSGSTPVLIGTSTTTSFGNTGLSIGTAYSYYVKAYDVAQNKSSASNTVSDPPPGLVVGHCSNNYFCWRSRHIPECLQCESQGGQYRPDNQALHCQQRQLG